MMIKPQYALLALLAFHVFPDGLAAQDWPAPPRPGSSRWGADDQRGAANLQTDEKVLEAARLIRTGKVYPLGRLYEAGMPLFTGRQFSVVMHLAGGPLGKNNAAYMEELLITQIGQVGTQLDGLGHAGIGDTYYNGNQRPDFQTRTGLTRLGIENAGVFFTRGLLLDIAALRGRARLENGYEITVEDLQQALKKQNLSIRPGDVVILHTGWGGLWNVDNALYGSGAPGIGIAAAEFLAAQQVMLVGADTFSLEVVPNPDPELLFPVHQVLLALHGIYILENLDTSALARDRVYEFAFSLAPLPLKGFTGSPGNPVAIR